MISRRVEHVPLGARSLPDAAAIPLSSFSSFRQILLLIV